jgi:hypothetical protein
VPPVRRRELQLQLLTAPHSGDFAVAAHCWATALVSRSVPERVGVGYNPQRMQSVPQPAASALEFIVSRVVEQAMHDHVSLSELEKQMLCFSESPQAKVEAEAPERLDAEYDNNAYEAKIAQLLCRAYQNDAKVGQQHHWQEALARLGSDNWYILVMLRLAGIKRSVGWDVTLLCIYAGFEMLIGMSYVRGVIDFGWAVIGLALFGLGVVRRIMLIKHRNLS